MGFVKLIANIYILLSTLMFLLTQFDPSSTFPMVHLNYVRCLWNSTINGNLGRIDHLIPILFDTAP